MKHLEKLSGLAIALLVLFTACEKDETKESNPTVQGIYEGSISGFQTKSTASEAESIPATSEISITGENKIQVHCYSDNFDTTFMMNYYMGKEHEEGDEHFGGFDMNDHSFSYTFQMDRNDFSDDLHFHGVKQ